MKRPEPESPDAERRANAAAEWLARCDRRLTAAEQDEFLQWLATDPRHGEWFALHRHTVADFSALAHWRPEDSLAPNPDLLAPPRRRLPWLAPASLVAAAIALAAVWWWTVPGKTGSSVAVNDEVERRILEDGSSVELNRGAVVTVAFSSEERRATLVRGEAIFTVAKNPARPFIVLAGGVKVRAVGTAFAVRLNRGDVDVLVTEGRVAVAAPQVERQNSGDAPASDPTPATSEVAAGQRATVSLNAAVPTQIVAVTAAESARLLTWQPQLLDFSSAPLAAAIGEFNRRNRVQFVLANPELATMPIVASIRSDNVEGFVRFLAASPGVQIERRSDTEIIIRRKP